MEKKHKKKLRKRRGVRVYTPRPARSGVSGKTCRWLAPFPPSLCERDRWLRRTQRFGLLPRERRERRRKGRKTHIAHGEIEQEDLAENLTSLKGARAPSFPSGTQGNARGCSPRGSFRMYEMETPRLFSRAGVVEQRLLVRAR